MYRQFIRVSLLKQYYDRTAEFMEYVADHPKLGKIIEDCIDALCLAVTGIIGLKNCFKSIPETPMRDSRGNPKSLIKNIPNKSEPWKAPVSVWLREMQEKRQKKLFR